MEELMILHWLFTYMSEEIKSFMQVGPCQLVGSPSRVNGYKCQLSLSMDLVSEMIRFHREELLISCWEGGGLDTVIKSVCQHLQDFDWGKAMRGLISIHGFLLSPSPFWGQHLTLPAAVPHAQELRVGKFSLSSDKLWSFRAREEQWPGT